MHNKQIQYPQNTESIIYYITFMTKSVCVWWGVCVHFGRRKIMIRQVSMFIAQIKCNLTTMTKLLGGRSKSRIHIYYEP